MYQRYNIRIFNSIIKLS